MRFSVALSVAVLAAVVAVVPACTPSGSMTSGRDQYPVRVVGPGGTTTLSVRADDATSSGILAHPIDVVWSGLPAVFDSLGIPVTRLDATARVIGNEGFRIRQRLGRVALSRYFDCGTTQVGANADSYDVFLVILARLRPAAAGTTTVDVSAQARARPLAFSQAYGACSSLGSFDMRFRELLRAQLTP